MGLGSGIAGAIEDLLNSARENFYDTFIEPILQWIVKDLMATPHPDEIMFSEPTSDPWVGFYNDIYLRIEIITSILFFMTIGAVLFTNMFRNELERKKSLKRVAIGFPLTLVWWWLGAWTLKLADVLTTAIMPEDIAAQQGDILPTLADLSYGVMLSFFILFCGAVIVLILAIVYLMRNIVLLMYYLMMPLLIWGASCPIRPVRNYSMGLIEKYVPLLAFPIPGVILLWLSTVFLQGNITDQPITGILEPVVGLAAMFLSGIIPLYFFVTASGAMRTVRQVVMMKAVMGSESSATSASSGASDGGGSAETSGAAGGGGSANSAGGSRLNSGRRRGQEPALASGSPNSSRRTPRLNFSAPPSAQSDSSVGPSEIRLEQTGSNRYELPSRRERNRRDARTLREEIHTSGFEQNKTFDRNQSTRKVGSVQQTNRYTNN